MLAILTDDPRRQESEWRRTIASVRETLAGLERTSDATDEKLKQQRTKATAWVSSLVDRLVTAATLETEAAIKRARAEAEGDIAQLQALVTHLQAEAEGQREEIARLEQLLEAEKTRTARLSIAFETIERAIAMVESATPPAFTAPAIPAIPLGKRSAAPRGTPPDAESKPPAKHTAEPDPALVEQVKQLLDEIESKYWSDLEAAIRPAEIVARLSENLRRARDMLGRHTNSTNGSAAALFEQQLAALLYDKSETSFGRHLAIAAHNHR